MASKRQPMKFAIVAHAIASVLLAKVATVRNESSEITTHMMTLRKANATKPDSSHVAAVRGLAKWCAST